MKRIGIGIVCASLGVGALAAAMAGEEGKAGGGKIGDVAWLTGTWVGTEGSEAYRETWGKAIDGGMLGMCHTMNRSGSPFYELILIAESPNGLEYRIMHFSQGMKAKHAEPNVMPAIEVTADRVVFMETSGENRARISYRKEGADRVVARVEHVRNGKATGFDIPLKRG